MNEPSPLSGIAGASRRVAQRALDLGVNRLELFAVEADEARERILRAFLLSLGSAVFGLLAGITLTCGVVLWLWPHGPLITLAILTLVYGGVSVSLFLCQNRLRSERQAFSDSLDQLRKDSKCLANILR